MSNVQLKVKWDIVGNCDGIHGMYGVFAVDRVNPSYGLRFYDVVYPRGKDGKGKRELDAFWTVKGHKGEIRSKTELIEVLRKLGHLPPEEETL